MWHRDAEGRRRMVAVAFVASAVAGADVRPSDAGGGMVVPPRRAAAVAGARLLQAPVAAGPGRSGGDAAAGAADRLADHLERRFPSAGGSGARREIAEGRRRAVAGNTAAPDARGEPAGEPAVRGPGAGGVRGAVLPRWRTEPSAALVWQCACGRVGDGGGVQPGPFRSLRLSAALPAGRAAGLPLCGRRVAGGQRHGPFCQQRHRRRGLLAGLFAGLRLRPGGAAGHRLAGHPGLLRGRRFPPGGDLR